MSWRLSRNGVVSESDKWPIRAFGGGGLPAISSWRQFGMSWFASGFDEQGGLERHRTRITERLAGALHLAPHAVMNESNSGAAVMKGMDPTNIGFGRVLRQMKPFSLLQSWPWECNRFGVEAFGFGVNDVGTGGISNSGMFWTGQGAMWNLVWERTMRSLVQRAIAGAIYFVGPGSLGVSQAFWHTAPNGFAAADFAFVPRGPGGTGAGSWQYKLDSTVCTSDGYWWTPANGDTVVITLPADYDTGTIALRHLCPGSWFDGPAVTRDPFGAPAPGTGTPIMSVRTGAEHPRSPASLVVTAPGYTSAPINCQALANRYNHSGTLNNPNLVNTANPGPGVIGMEDAMTHVSRHAIAPTPGDTKTVTLTVGGIPSGGWYGFDSWEIEAIPELRPIVIMFNVADPLYWSLIYGFNPQPVWDLASARAAEYSATQARVAAEYNDPGIMVADIRSKIKTRPQSYGALLDNDIFPGLSVGHLVESSAYPIQGSIAGVPGLIMPGTGDGTHPHGIGAHLIAEAAFDAIIAANLPKGRGVIPFAPSRSMAYARSSSG